jgi:hypothetical protein
MADKYPNLPGVVLDLKDGNLSIFPEDATPRVLILGTAAQGTSSLTRVTRTQLAQNEYGLSGTLLRGMLEARQGGATNIYLLRIGGQPARLAGIGDSTGEGGLTIQTAEQDQSAGDNTLIFWDDSAAELKVWDENENLVYDSGAGLNTGYVLVTGTAVGGAGSDIGTSNTPVAISAVTETGTTYTTGTNGATPTMMELYEYLDAAYSLLEAFNADYIVPMGTFLDVPNIADTDIVTSSVTNETVGTGDGREKTFTLAHKNVVPATVIVGEATAVTNEAVGTGNHVLTSFDLDHAGVVSGTLTAKVDGSTTACTLSVGTGTGGVDQVHFSAAPGDGLAVTCSYSYAVAEPGQFVFSKGTGVNGMDQIIFIDAPSNYTTVKVNYSYMSIDGLLYFRKYEVNGEVMYEWYDQKTRVDGNTTYSYNEVNFAYQLAAFCHSLSSNENFSLGMINTSLPASGSHADLKSWVGSLPTYDINGAVSSNGTGLLGNKFMSGSTAMAPGFWWDDSQMLDEATSKDAKVTPDIGRYLSITCTPVTFYNAVDTTGYGYIAGGAALYAGFVAMLPGNQASTNKVLSGVALPFALTKTKVDLLAGAKYVPFLNKPRGVTIADGPTAATSQSDYQRLSTIRIVMEYVDRARAILEPYLGNSSSGATRAAMQTAIEEMGAMMIENGTLQDHRPLVSATAQQQVQGQATLEVQLVPAFELRKIQLVIGLSAA